MTTGGTVLPAEMSPPPASGDSPQQTQPDDPQRTPGEGSWPQRDAPVQREDVGQHDGFGQRDEPDQARNAGQAGEPSQSRQAADAGQSGQAGEPAPAGTDQPGNLPGLPRLFFAPEPDRQQPQGSADRPQHQPTGTGQPAG